MITSKKLIVDNIGLVRYFARKYYQRCRILPIEDLFSIGSYALVKAARTFDPERGFKFSSYAGAAVARAIIAAIGDEIAVAALFAQGYAGDDTEREDFDSWQLTLPCTESPTHSQYCTGIDLNRRLACLDDRSRDVVLSRAAGYTYQEIGARHGFTRQYAQDTHKRALQRLAA